MKRREMLERLEHLRDFCINMQKQDAPEDWQDDEVALTTAINLLGDGFVDNVEYTKDLINYLFIFAGIIVMFLLIIVCRM